MATTSKRFGRTVPRSTALAFSVVVMGSGVIDAGCTLKDQACKQEVLFCELDATKIVACFETRRFAV